MPLLPTPEYSYLYYCIFFVSADVKTAVNLDTLPFPEPHLKVLLAPRAAAQFVFSFPFIDGLH